jgi:hypothetical protein
MPPKKRPPANQSASTLSTASTSSSSSSSSASTLLFYDCSDGNNDEFGKIRHLKKECESYLDNKNDSSEDKRDLVKEVYKSCSDALCSDEWSVKPPSFVK